MRPTVRTARNIRKAALISALSLLAATSGCGGSTEPVHTATLTLISGGNQTVTLVPGGFADLPQPVVVRLDKDGAPFAGGDLTATISMSVPGPGQQQYAFATGADGTASMQLQVGGDVAGPFNITVVHWICVSGFFFCTATRNVVALNVPGVAVH
jgi:hypothetical protein